MKIEISRAIIAIVEAMLPRGTVDKLLFLSIRLSYDFFDDNLHLDHKDSAGVFVFHRPSNYTKVLFTKVDDIFIQPYDLEEMLLTSDHDSGWRGDGVESTLRALHFSKCEELKKEIASKKGEKYADSHHRFIYSSYPSFASFESIKIIDGTVIRTDRDKRKFRMEFDKEKQFYTFKSEE